MIKLLRGDCLDRMYEIEDGSIDLVLTDPPYGTTACKWDAVIEFAPMWEHLYRVCNKNATIVLFGTEPFSSALRMSNIKNFKYDWYWRKNLATNFLHAKRQPLRNVEVISVFYKKAFYIPQKSTGHAPTQSARGSSTGSLYHGNNVRDYAGGDTTRYPKQAIGFKTVDPKQRVHPSQKPVALLEYLIKTYTQEGATVLDFSMGSGSTGIACMNTGRNFIGIEKDPDIFITARERIKDHRKALAYI